MTATHPNDLLNHIRSGASVLMDGAMGTELERRNVPIEGNGWSALAVRDYGDVIRQIHEDYIHAGARLHIVNSFALARHVLEPLNFGDRFESFNRQVVEIFEEAVVRQGIDRKVLWAAGSLSTFAANSDRSLLPKGDALAVNFRDQARILRDAGVDLFALEMLFDVEVSLAMLKAVEEFELPVILGFTCDWGDEDGTSVITARGMGCPATPLDEVLRPVIDGIGTDKAILSIMHSEADVTDAALDILRQHWNGPVAVYPNSGTFVDLHMQFDSVCSADAFAQAAQRWMDGGVQIIGGCCGLGPAHIHAISEI